MLLRRGYYRAFQEFLAALQRLVPEFPNIAWTALANLDPKILPSAFVLCTTANDPAEVSLWVISVVLGTPARCQLLPQGDRRSRFPKSQPSCVIRLASWRNHHHRKTATWHGGQRRHQCEPSKSSVGSPCLRLLRFIGISERSLPAVCSAKSHGNGIA